MKALGDLRGNAGRLGRLAVLREAYQTGFADGVVVALRAAIGDPDDAVESGYAGPPLPREFIAWARQKLIDIQAAGS